MNNNLFPDDHSFPDSLRELGSYYLEGYVVNEIKLKTDFRNLHPSFVQLYANFQKSGMGDGINDDDDENCENETKEKSSNFVFFYRGDMCLLYLCLRSVTSMTY